MPPLCFADKHNKTRMIKPSYSLSVSLLAILNKIKKSRTYKQTYYSYARLFGIAWYFNSFNFNQYKLYTLQYTKSKVPIEQIFSVQHISGHGSKVFGNFQDFFYFASVMLRKTVSFRFISWLLFTETHVMCNRTLLVRIACILCACRRPRSL